MCTGIKLASTYPHQLDLIILNLQMSRSFKTQKPKERGGNRLRNKKKVNGSS